MSDEDAELKKDEYWQTYDADLEVITWSPK
jgi:hypothetical protein